MHLACLLLCCHLAAKGTHALANCSPWEMLSYCAHLPLEMFWLECETPQQRVLRCTNGQSFLPAHDSCEMLSQLCVPTLEWMGSIRRTFDPFGKLHPRGFLLYGSSFHRFMTVRCRFSTVLLLNKILTHRLASASFFGVLTCHTEAEVTRYEELIQFWKFCRCGFKVVPYEVVW